ncbi:MAG: hypothetical protein AMJ53_02890 [Gammaproteobacteria bacterium SG8_11]|nr:MAG: hypothetical protein AMJ53_02890 [Gammaproteobacteria bacterium SG8_11]
MSRKLNNTNVPEKLFNEATSIKRQGGKVFLVIGDDRALKPGHCHNCNGTGAVGYQFFTGGPYDATPTIQNMLPSPNQPNNVSARATFHDGKWYRQKTRTFACPDCEGTGIIGGKATPSPAPVTL